MTRTSKAARELRRKAAPRPGAGAIDPIQVSVLQRRLKSITEEMGLTLLRTTRSPILNEARDFVTGLYDARGRMIEQTEYIPVLAFALQPACENVVRFFGDDVHPGDVILHNDVFSGGNQNNDVAVFKPVFHGAKLVAWAACKGHQADIGGAVRGGYNPEAREVWQEALRIPAVKVVERGRLRRDVWNLIFSNVRLKIVEEDIKAQIGGCTVGERGYKALIERFGATRLDALIEHLFDSTEKMVRSEIAAIPDGTYRGESWAYYDGVTDGTKMRIALAVTVEADTVTFDFTGSSPQTPGFVNAPASATASALLLTFLMLINPDIPHNAGILRPIRIVNPEGSFLNARFPAATTFGNSITGPTSDAVFRAFAQALPRMVTAGWNRFLGFAVSGHDPRRDRPYVDILFLSLKGGSGGTYLADGYDHIGLINCAGGILAQDYEMFEIHDPHLLLRHEYLPDSAGPGRWRGGLGVVTEFVLNGDDTMGVAFGDGVEEAARAFGFFGGKPGSRNLIRLHYPDGTERLAKSKEIVRDIPRGTVFHQLAGGGGGYGDPRERPIERVLADVRDGVVSLASARDDYGVLIDARTMTVDRVRTAELRGAAA
ncbi:MAG: hydantoinase B/oxoprolinase family protein [Burkholderiales bacterium]|nr:MAG: hydantoinase B/oxoprolinase family protein [Burkholderiales bacterium]